MTGRRAERAHPQSVRRTSFTLNTSMSPPSDTDPPSKVAATVTRQPFILGSFRLTLALGASGFEWLTVLASAMTVMVMAGTSRPFTTVNAVAARGLGGFAATRGSGDGVAGGVTGQRPSRVVQAERARPVSVWSRWATRLELSWAA